MTTAGDVLLQECDSPTTFFVNRHSVLDTWEQKGTLIGYLSQRRPVYQMWRREEEDSHLIVREEEDSHLIVREENDRHHIMREEDDSHLVVREEDGSVLAAEQTLWCDTHLAVCGDEDKIAVIASIDQTLAILSIQGEWQNAPCTVPCNLRQSL